MTDEYRKKQKKYRKYTKEVYGWVFAVAVLFLLIGGIHKAALYFGESERINVKTEYKPFVENWLTANGYSYDKIKYMGKGERIGWDYTDDCRAVYRKFLVTNVTDPTDKKIEKALFYFETPYDDENRFYDYFCSYRKMEVLN